MLKALVLLSSLALAAAASAQTASLDPVARGGFVLAPRAVAWNPVSTFRTALSGSGRATNREGWAAEYDLSVLPIGARIVSASLVSSLSSVSGLRSGLTLELDGYAGDGAVGPGDMGAGATLADLATADWTAGRLDVAASVQARLDAGDRYAGFNLAPAAGLGGAAWSSPRLEVAYVVDHGIAKKGWPIRGGTLGSTKAGGSVIATGVAAESRPDHHGVVVGSNGWMYFASGGQVVAEDASGTERWRQNASYARLFALSADGTLYAMSEDLAAIDAATGQVRWSVHLQPYNSKPRKVQVLSDGAVIVEQELDAAAYDRDGRYLWGSHFETHGLTVTDDDTLVDAPYGFGPSLVYDGLNFRNAHTGQLLRHYPVNGSVSPPIASGNTVAWTTYEPVGPPRYSHGWTGYGPGRYYAVTTLQDYALRLWTCPTGGEPAATVLGTATATAYASHDNPNVRPAVPGPPSAGDLGLAPNGLYVIALGTSTEVVGPNTRHSLPPVGSYDFEAVFAVSSQSVLYSPTGAYDLATGTKLWSYSPSLYFFQIFVGADGALWYEFYDRIQRIR